MALLAPWQARPELPRPGPRSNPSWPGQPPGLPALPPGWEGWAGVGGMLYASHPNDIHPPVVVRARDAAELVAKAQAAMASRRQA